MAETELVSQHFDAVVFDLGNVLVHWDPYHAFASEWTREQTQEFFDEIDFPALNLAHDAGLSWDETIERLGDQNPDHARALQFYIDHFADALTGPVDGSEEFVREAQAEGCRTFGLTNWSAQTFHFASSVPSVALLDDVLVSGVEGMAKPDLRIFELAIARWGLDPSRTLFIDDSAHNVEAARRAGLHAILFTDVVALRRELRSLPTP